jgi:glutamyl-tRNA reductase
MENLEGRVGVLLGAGSMAGLVGSHLRGQGLADLVVANRTPARAQELAATCGGRAARLEDLADEVLAADFLVAACAAPAPLLRGAGLAPRWARRRGRCLVAVDLSVPRVIDPDVASLEAVSLWDLDALDGLLRGELDRRKDAVRQVEALIRHEIEAFWRWYAGRGSVAPLLAALVARCEAIRCQAVERNVRFLGASDPARVERFTQSLVAKLIDRPMRQIQTWDATTPEGLLRLEIVKELFGVEEEGEGSIGDLFEEVGSGAPGRPAGGGATWTT